MKKIITILLVFTLAIFTGCEKQLNITPTNSSPEVLALSTTDGMDAALSYAYIQLHNSLSRPFTLWSELFADDVLFQGTLANYKNFYVRDLNAIVQEQVSATDTRSVNMTVFRQMYAAINAAALIIRGANNDLAAGDPTFAPNKNRLIGEGHFVRGVTTFQTLRYFSKPWGATADNSHLGIVMNTEPVPDRESQIQPRSTVAQVYAAIIADLQQAVTLLPEAYNAGVHPASYNGRATKDAARAYLARVYFQQQNYVAAKQQIDLILGATAGTLTKHALNGDVVAIFTTRGPTNIDPENIYQTTASLEINSPSTYWYSGTDAPYATPGAGVNANIVASNAFLQGVRYAATDTRFLKWLTAMPNGQLQPKKYTLAQQINIPIIRSAEMVLDRAEINALAGNLPDAIADCNAIRSRAQITLLPNNIAAGSLLDSIRNERRRELCFEGDRLWDLKRRKAPIPPGDRAATPNLPWDGLELVLKYSADEMGKNPALVNNY